MIALTIFAAMAIVISDTASQSASSLIHLQDKTLAAMVAENRMAELRLNGLPPQGGAQRSDQHGRPRLADYQQGRENRIP